MLAHNDHRLLEEALARRAELQREADLNRLLRGCQQGDRGHLDSWLAGFGGFLVRWGTRLQQRSTGATAQTFTL
jgi:hypothetical protein